MADNLRAALVELLREPDTERPLDSLETLAVLARLEHDGYPVGGAAPDSCPHTIAQWVAWAGEHSRTAVETR